MCERMCFLASVLSILLKYFGFYIHAEHVVQISLPTTLTYKSARLIHKYSGSKLHVLPIYTGLWIHTFGMIRPVLYIVCLPILNNGYNCCWIGCEGVNTDSYRHLRQADSFKQSDISSCGFFFCKALVEQLFLWPTRVLSGKDASMYPVFMAFTEELAKNIPPLNSEFE